MKYETQFNQQKEWGGEQAYGRPDAEMRRYDAPVDAAPIHQIQKSLQDNESMTEMVSQAAGVNP